LKRSGQRWYQKLIQILVSTLGFIQVKVNQAVFCKQSGDKLTFIVVHVDDCTIAATTIELVVDLKT
jgi:hypothetical protein